MFDINAVESRDDACNSIYYESIFERERKQCGKPEERLALMKRLQDILSFMESVDNEKKGGGNADFSDVQLKRKTLCEGGNDQNEKRVMRGEERLSGESSPISEKQSELKEDKEDSTIKKCQHMEALGGLEKVAEAGEVAGCIDVDGKKRKLFCAKSDQEKKRMKRGDKMTGDESTEDREKIVMETLRRLFPDDLNLIKHLEETENWPIGTIELKPKSQNSDGESCISSLSSCSRSRKNWLAIQEQLRLLLVGLESANSIYKNTLLTIERILQEVSISLPQGAADAMLKTRQLQDLCEVMFDHMKTIIGKQRCIGKSPGHDDSKENGTVNV